MLRWHVAIGTLAIVGVIGALVFLAINEQDRMQDFTLAFEARQIEQGAAIYANNCASCHGPQGRGIEGVAPALNTASLFDGTRLQETGFGGTIEDFVHATVASGRPVPSAGTSYPQRMPTWSEEFGGPLRGDQVDNVVAFVMNWEERALEGGEPGAGPVENPVGSDITVELPEGDPVAGETLAQDLGCTGCHILSTVGPPWEGEGDQAGMGARAASRIEQENYTGDATTAQQYLIESIVLTNAHVVEGYDSGLMPGNYGERITEQNLADLIAYLLTFD